MFLMAAINVPFIVMDPQGAWMNWASFVFCFGLAISAAIQTR